MAAKTELKAALQDLRLRQTPTSPDLKEWWESGEQVGARTTRALFLSLAALSALAGVVTATAAMPFFMKSSHTQADLLVVAAMLWVGAPVLVVAGFWRYGAVKADFMRRYQRQKIYSAIDDISTDPELQTVLRLNQARMDAYHELTLTQAAHAYRNTQAAMAVGFLVLAAGAAIALATKTAPTNKVVVGALAGLGTAVSGYIVSTFLRAQQEALSQLNVYFRQPLTTSYLLTAERWALKLPAEERPSLLAHMADEVVAQAFGVAAPESGHADGPARSRHGDAPHSQAQVQSPAPGAGPDIAAPANLGLGPIPALSDLAAVAAMLGLGGGAAGAAVPTLQPIAG